MSGFARSAPARHGTPAHKFAVIVADVDDLKLVNDTLGHVAGDEALIAVARFLADNIREVDLSFRLGGDEFAVLLPCTDEAGCRVVMERLRAAFDVAAAATPFPIGLSMGCAVPREGSTTPSAVMERADTEMYLNKRERKTGRTTASR